MLLGEAYEGSDCSFKRAGSLDAEDGHSMVLSIIIIRELA